MLTPELAYEALDSLWENYGGLGCVIRGSEVMAVPEDSFGAEQPIVAKIDPLAVAMQDRELTTSYVDVPGDIFFVDGCEPESLSQNSQSIHPMIDARPNQLKTIDDAEGIFMVGMVCSVGRLCVRQVLFAWRENGSHLNKSAAGFWTAEGGPQPRCIRMYPGVLPRHVAVIEKLWQDNL